MENRRRTPPEVHPPHWSPGMALVMLMALGIVTVLVGEFR